MNRRAVARIERSEIRGAALPQTESLIPDFAPVNPGYRAAGQEKTPPGGGVRMGGSLQANPLPVWTEVWGD